MRPHPASYVFLPLIALVAIDLAPPVDASPGDRDARGSSASSSSRSSGGSVGRSSGGSSRSSGGSLGRSSGGSSRSSGSSFGSSGSSSRPSLGSSSGSSLGRSSSGSTRPVVTGTSGSPGSSSSGSSRTRFVTSPPPAPAATTRSIPSSAAPSPSYSSGAAVRAGALDATGEAYAPAPRAVAFPTPSNSGRTTYARRFDTSGTSGGDPFAGRRASTETGGTLGVGGVGSVTSAIQAERRALASRGPSSPSGPASSIDSLSSSTTTSARGTSLARPETRVRSPHSPGAGYRRSLAEAAAARRSPSSSPELSAQTELEPGRDRADLSLRQMATKRRLAAALDPSGSKLVSTLGRGVASATGTAVAAATRPLLGEVGSRLVSGPFTADYGDAPASDFGGYGGSDYTSPYGDPDCHPGYGFGWWDSFGNYHPPYSSPYTSWWGWSFGWSSSWGLHLSYGWNWWDGYGYGWGPSYCPPYAYYPTVVTHYYYDDPDPIYIYEQSEPTVVYVYADGPAGEATAPAAAPAGQVQGGGAVDAGLAAGAGSAGDPAAGPEPLGVASLRYLELGDAAFSDQRFADAVHFYSRAVEFEPERGMLRLVLADALFATGDYHSCAHEIRRALELEPSLVAAPVDKHQFYADPVEFDRQLATLELYVKERPDDVDARLVLGLNLLFGGRPLAAKELLESGPQPRTGDQAGELIRAAADQARWGDNPPAEAAWD